MRPIPRKLLIHHVIFKRPTTTDTWQKVDADKQSLQHVRIEPCSKIVQSKDNTKIQLTSLLIYDCHNSDPADVIFAASDPPQKILWAGREYVIATAEPLYDGRKIHHWEVGLV